MLTIEDHVSLVWNRLCRNRTSLRLAMKRANHLHLIDPIVTYIQDVTIANNTLINKLDAILNYLGRPIEPPG